MYTTLLYLTRVERLFLIDPRINKKNKKEKRIQFRILVAPTNNMITEAMETNNIKIELEEIRRKMPIPLIRETRQPDYLITLLL